MIEEEHPELDLTFLDFKDEDEDGEEVHIVYELSVSQKENVAALLSSTADAAPSEPPLDTTPQKKVGD